MKHIKTINEFRTVGFRYSEPKLGFNISFFYKGELNSKDISNVLKRLDIKSSDINVNNNYGTLEINDHEVEVDGSVDFDIFVYDEETIEDLLKEVGKLIYSVFKVETYGYDVTEHKENLEL